MTQTLALFLDAYRDLNSRKLFWLAIIISGLVVVVVGAVGIDEAGVSVFGARFDSPFINTNFIPRETFYKLLFTNLGVKFWLSWLGTIFALISTASMVPDMVAGGSIDMLLSKPITRGRLFLTRWCTGLMFAGIQAMVFVTASFLVIGIRGGAWEPALFLAVPVLVIFFSYLFCVCALVGLLTRSTIASLILTLIFWVVVFGLQQGETFLNVGRIASRMEAEATERLINTRLATNADADVDGLRKDLEAAKQSFDRWDSFYWPFYGAVTCLPKTVQTTDWLERQLVEYAKLGRPTEEDKELSFFGPRRVKQREFEEAVHADVSQRKGALWTIGTSLCFEAAILAGCVWVFRRRDY